MITPKGSILVIDDDIEFLKDISVLLSPHFIVSLATGSARGMDDLVKIKPDCLLLDINMEGFFGNNRRFEGLALLEELKKNPRYSSVSTIPVILLSSTHHPEKFEDPSRFGADAFFPKPVDIDRLVDKIMELKKIP